MTLQSGSSLGRYEVVAPLGAGGMGEVYRALDRELEREVALKVLPEEVSRDAERLSRFEREAKALAALNHPNVATLHGLEREAGNPFLVMELVEGETLAERIARGPLSLEEATDVFSQIAEGLAAAHYRGLVHRDLKPANVKITPEGQVRVLDFGLAKAIASEGRPAGIGETHSPTLSVGATAAGVLLGTAGYMSPEQIRGIIVDRRTDVWAWGCCLYEALTGSRAFPGTDTTEILAGVLKDEPRWGPLGSFPEPVQRCVRRCLEKDPGRRLRDVGDAAYELRHSSEAQVSSRESEPSEDRWRPKALALAAGAILGALAVVLLSGWSADRSAEDGRPRQTRHFAVPNSGMADLDALFWKSVAISADGANVYYIARAGDVTRIHRWGIHDGSHEEFGGTEKAQNLAISPNGAMLSFQSDDELRVLDLETRRSSFVRRGSFFGSSPWLDEDTLVASGFRTFPTDLHDVELHSLSSGESTPLIATEPGRAAFTRCAFWRERVVAVGTAPIPGNVGLPETWLIEADTKRITRIEDAAAPACLTGGYLAFSRQGSPWVGRVDFEDLVLDAVQPLPIPVGRWGPGAHLLLADQGTLVYRAGAAPRKRLAWLDRDGGLEVLGLPEAAYRSARTAPGQDLVAVTVGAGTNSSDLHVAELALGSLGTPIDTRVSWPSSFGSRGWIYSRGWGEDAEIRALEGRGTVTLTREYSLTAPVVAANYLVGVMSSAVFQETDAGEVTTPDRSVESDPEASGLAPLPRARLGSGEGARNFAVSPDEQWLVWESEPGGTFEIWAASVSAPEEVRPISSRGGFHPVFHPDGSALYYLDPTGEWILEVPIENDLACPFGVPRRLLKLPEIVEPFYWVARLYDVGADGRFLVPVGDPRGRDVRVVLDFDRELERLFGDTP